MPWGYRSYWLQPWRSQLVTRSALSFEDALGMNFKINSVGEAQATARLLAEAGIRRARVEFGWNSMEFDDPTQVAPQWSAWLIAADRGAARKRHPTVDPARFGVRLSHADEAVQSEVERAGSGRDEDGDAEPSERRTGRAGEDRDRPGRGCRRGPYHGREPRGVASLSRPLPTRLRAGPVAASTLRFAPFAPPRLADGAPNPRFRAHPDGLAGVRRRRVAELVKRAPTGPTISMSRFGTRSAARRSF